MGITKELYEVRNYWLNVATSYRGKDKRKVRLMAWNEAFRLSTEIDKMVAEQTVAPEPKQVIMSIAPDGRILSIYLLLEDNGITRKYVRPDDWVLRKTKINPMSRYERYLWHEAKADKDALELRDMVDKLAKASTPPIT